MKKILKLLLSLIIFIIIIVIFLCFLFFEDTYQTRYSSGLSNAKTVSIVINNAIKNNQIELTDNNTIVYGIFNNDKVYVTSINGAKTDIEFNSGSALGNLYWAALVENRRAHSAWTCNVDLLEDSKLMPYKYGDQKNLISVYSRRFIGYYSSEETTND